MIALIIRIVFPVFVILFPPVLAALIDPALTSKVHLVVIGLTGLCFSLSERFFASIKSDYKDLHKSEALTGRESQRLEEQIVTIKRTLEASWLFGFILRIFQIVTAGVAYFVPSTSLMYFFLILGGYALFGGSIVCLLVFLVTARTAERFRRRFDAAERREKERQEGLRARDNQLVKS